MNTHRQSRILFTGRANTARQKVQLCGIAHLQGNNLHLMGTARKGWAQVLVSLPQVSLRASMTWCSVVRGSASNPWRRPSKVFVAGSWTPASQAINSLGWIGVGDVHVLITY